MWWVTLSAIVLAVVAALWFAPKGWRTIAVNIAAAVGAVIPAAIDYLVGGSVDLAALLPPELAIYLIPGINILNMILRRITTTPLGQKR